MIRSHLSSLLARQELLHTGSLPAYACYGCWELSQPEERPLDGLWPFSLVSETTAEVYLIQKQDMLRTVAKKLFAALLEISQAFLSEIL